MAIPSPFSRRPSSQGTFQFRSPASSSTPAWKPRLTGQVTAPRRGCLGQKLGSSSRQLRELTWLPQLRASCPGLRSGIPMTHTCLLVRNREHNPRETNSCAGPGACEGSIIPAAVTSGGTGPCDSPPPAGNADDGTDQQHGDGGERFPLSLPGVMVLPI